jgi:enoyl-CoA hydratase/carnithine racemase
MSESIVREQDGPIATVVLNRPGQRNAITYEMWSRLQTLAGELDADPQVRVIVFKGAGESAFSSGADIGEFETRRNNSTLGRAYAEKFEGALEAVATIGKPTLSLIRGFCVGGGLELATMTDLRIAADDARFGVPIAQLGILVGYKEMRALVALVGPGPALNLLLTARLINAEEALRIGLITEQVAGADVQAHTYALARRISQLAPLSARWHKQILQTVLTNPALSDLSPEEVARPFACFDTADFQEGRQAFLEKRPPNFKGQ